MIYLNLKIPVHNTPNNYYWSPSSRNNVIVYLIWAFMHAWFKVKNGIYIFDNNRQLMLLYDNCIQTFLFSTPLSWSTTRMWFSCQQTALGLGMSYGTKWGENYLVYTTVFQRKGPCINMCLTEINKI